MSQFLAELFQAADPSRVAGDTGTARAILRQGVARVEGLTSQPLVQARMPGIALMGNVAPLELMAMGTAGEVQAAALDCLRKTGGRGLILSAGGGVSPGTPASAVDALIAARDAFEAEAAPAVPGA